MPMYQAAVTWPPASSSSSYAHFLSLVHQQHGGAQFGALGGLFVSVADMEKLDAKIRNLNSDVFAASAGDAPSAAEPEAFAAWLGKVNWLMEFRWSWTSFRVRWTAWVDSHGSLEWFLDSPQEFSEFQSQYNEFLRQFRQEMGAAATTATQARPEKEETEAPDVTGAVKFASFAVIALVGAYLISKAT